MEMHRTCQLGVVGDNIKYRYRQIQIDIQIYRYIDGQMDRKLYRCIYLLEHGNAQEGGQSCGRMGRSAGAARTRTDPAGCSCTRTVCQGSATQIYRQIARQILVNKKDRQIARTCPDLSSEAVFYYYTITGLCDLYRHKL